MGIIKGARNIREAVSSDSSSNIYGLSPDSLHRISENCIGEESSNMRKLTFSSCYM